MSATSTSAACRAVSASACRSPRSHSPALPSPSCVRSPPSLARSLTRTRAHALPRSQWDNSTRGLDSATAVSFCQSVRNSVELTGGVASVAIYQAPQPAYDCFTKAIVLYEGRSIFFGAIDKAKQFFVDMGFECPEQQTVPDFLTSLTSPTERRARQGWETRVPRTPQEFEARWKASDEYRALKAQLAEYNQQHPLNGNELETFKAARRDVQSKHVRPASPFTLSYRAQVALCLRRGFWRLKADPSLTVFQLFGNTAMALVVSSVFFNLAPTTATFYSRGALLFFAILLNGPCTLPFFLLSSLAELTLSLSQPSVPPSRSSRSTRSARSSTSSRATPSTTLRPRPSPRWRPTCRTRSSTPSSSTRPSTS